MGRSSDTDSRGQDLHQHQGGIADNGKRMAQPKGFGMVTEFDVKAFRKTTTNIDDRYNKIWTKALREKFGSCKA